MWDFLAAMTAGLAMAVSWPALGFLAVGVAVGALVGLLPGLGGPAMLAMLIPFTLSLEPLPAFALLFGAASVTATTGDVSSILLGVPGEAVSAAIVEDGHAMARQGEAGRAIGAALASSLVGTLVGAAVLVAVIPFARPLLLSLGSPELFMLAVVGIAFMTPLVGRQPLKGLISGGLGLLVAMVGLDPVHGTPRYTFDWVFLWDGVSILPVALGLFAIPEAVALASVGASSAGPPVAIGAVSAGVVDVVRRWTLVMRCGALGSAVGIVPGMGGSVAQWVAYAHATGGRTRGGDGAGRVEGVLGPAAANNAAIGGSLVPLLLFGIPGSLTTAVLLGGFIIKGIVPGETMLGAEAEGGRLSLVFALVWFLVIANLAVVAVFAPFVRRLAGLSRLPGGLVVPTVLVCTFAGAFLEKNAIEEVFVTAAAGVAGWIMVAREWPRAPLIFGLALGAVAENRLILSMSLYGLDWVRRPGVLVIGAIGAAVLLHAVLRRPAAETFAPTRAGAQPARSIADVLLPVFVLAVTAAAWQASSQLGDARLFPRTILLGLAALSTAQLVIECRAWRQMSATNVTVSPALFWAGGFLLAIWTLGFGPGGTVMTGAYLHFGARAGWRVSIAQAVVVLALLEGLLARVLAVPFPDGVLVALIAGTR